MINARSFADRICLVIAFAVLLQGAAILFARDLSPNFATTSLGSLLRTRMQELEYMPRVTGGPLNELEVLREIRSRTPPDSLFLTFYQRGFAYYAGRPFISDLDPRLVAFYRADDKLTAVTQLRKLRVNYIYYPPWSWPTINRSLIKAITDDATLSTLVLEKFGFKVYRLN
jgi:hypothetical protein